MLKIQPVRDEERRGTLLSAHGMPMEQRCAVLEAGENGTCTGSLVFSREGERAVLWSVFFGEDQTLLDGLARAAASIAMDAGAKTVECENAALFGVLSSVGFHKIGNKMVINLPQFFQRCCAGRNPR